MKIPASLPDAAATDDPDESAADATGEDCGSEALEARVAQLETDREYLIDTVEKLSEQFDRVLGDDGGGGGVGVAGGDDDRIDTPDDSRAHRGYE